MGYFTPQKRTENLNEWMLTDSPMCESANRRISIGSQDDKIIAVFRDLEGVLIAEIKHFQIVVGCVAWLTNELILEALSQRDRVSIVIQKEDFLRPDSGNWSGRKLREMYSKLPAGPTSSYKGSEYWGKLVDGLSHIEEWTAEPIRWFGNFNKDKKPAFPRMHNKFLVFCDLEPPSIAVPKLFEPERHDFWLEYMTEFGYSNCVVPKTVWTGSFNMTDNATKSLENAVIIRDTDIACGYFNEWQHIFSMSESISSEFWDNTWTPDTFYMCKS